jgi:uncharacterized protein
MTQPGPNDGEDREPPDVRRALDAALRAALAAKDRTTVAAVRSALAAIGNAEAVSGAVFTPGRSGSKHIAGASAGLGSAEVPRRVLGAAEIWDIVGTEITERRQAARQYLDAGHSARAARLVAEANALQAVLGAPGDSSE